MWGDNCRMIEKYPIDAAVRRGLVSLAKSRDLQLGNPWTVRDLGVMLATVEPILEGVDFRRLPASLKRSIDYLASVGITVTRELQPHSKTWWAWSFAVDYTIFDAQVASDFEESQDSLLGEESLAKNKSVEYGNITIQVPLDSQSKLDAIYKELVAIRTLLEETSE